MRLFSSFALNEKVLADFGKYGGPYLTLMFRYKWLRKLVSKLVCKPFQLAHSDIVEELCRNTPELNFTYTSREFQLYNRDFPEPQYYFIGPSIAGRGSTGSEMDFQKLQKPIVYISMGTLVNHSKGFYTMCFEAFRNKPVSVILSLGHGKKVSDFTSVPDNFQLYSFVPQLEVLQNCDLFITHGGMNSVNEAIYYGVPMLVIPVANDQPTVARRVEELYLGKWIDRKKCTSGMLYETACEIMQSKKCRASVEKFKQEAQASGGNAWAVERIAEYAKGIKRWEG